MSFAISLYKIFKLVTEIEECEVVCDQFPIDCNGTLSGVTKYLQNICPIAILTGGVIDECLNFTPLGAKKVERG